MQVNRQRPMTEVEECSNIFKRFASHKPPTYNGKPDLIEFEEWISDMEKLFDATQCPDKHKVNFSVFYIQGQAYLWWKSVKGIQNEPDIDWEKLKQAIRNQFYMQSLQLQMESEFVHLKQRKMSVLEYAVKFNEPARFALDMVSTDRERMNRFEGGLNLDLREHLSSYLSNSYQELYDRAINVESMMKLREEILGNTNRKGTTQGGNSNNGPFKRPNNGNHRGIHK
ncbi:Activity-regulated cytoskeleton associated protein 1 [Bienertia sinuspersici]